MKPEKAPPTRIDVDSQLWSVIEADPQLSKEFARLALRQMEIEISDRETDLATKPMRMKIDFGLKLLGMGLLVGLVVYIISNVGQNRLSGSDAVSIIVAICVLIGVLVGVRYAIVRSHGDS